MIKVPGLERYFGGKNGSGTPQQIINLQPVHSGYAEFFLGSGGAMKRKKPALVNLGTDLNMEVVYLWQQAAAKQTKAAYTIVCGNALDFLKDMQGKKEYKGIPIKDWLVYLDPPYPSETRTDFSGSQYLFEMQGDSQDELLKTILTLECMVMISTYPNLKYDTYLSKWNKHEFKAMSRGGVRDEVLYYNYPKPTLLHDTRFTGSNYRQRERIKNRVTRNTERLIKMEATERNAILINILKHPGILTPEIEQLLHSKQL